MRDILAKSSQIATDIRGGNNLSCAAMRAGVTPYALQTFIRNVSAETERRDAGLDPCADLDEAVRAYMTIQAARAEFECSVVCALRVMALEEGDLRACVYLLNRNPVHGESAGSYSFLRSTNVTQSVDPGKISGQILSIAKGELAGSKS